MEKLYPGSVDPKGGSENSVDILLNYIYLPTETPLPQCHLAAPAEEIVREDLATRGDPRTDGFLKIFHDTIEQSSAFASGKVDLSREEMDGVSEEWRAGPGLTEEDVEWLRERIVEDRELVDLYGREKLEEMANVARTTMFQMRAPMNLKKAGLEQHIRGV